jgi:hypothetical protein
MLTGSVTVAASLGLASLATSLIAFQFIFGLMVGASCAAILPPMMATVTGWFDTHRSLARQSYRETSHAASGAIVIGAMPMPAETSDTGTVPDARRKEWRETDRARDLAGIFFSTITGYFLVRTNLTAN